MTHHVALPDDLVHEVMSRVDAGEFASLDEAIVALVRRGLASPREKPFKPGGPPRPTPPDPSHREPGDDRPIHVDPRDVNWVE